MPPQLWCPVSSWATVCASMLGSPMPGFSICTACALRRLAPTFRLCKAALLCAVQNCKLKACRKDASLQLVRGPAQSGGCPCILQNTRRRLPQVAGPHHGQQAERRGVQQGALLGGRVAAGRRRSRRRRPHRVLLAAFPLQHVRAWTMHMGMSQTWMVRESKDSLTVQLSPRRHHTTAGAVTSDGTIDAACSAPALAGVGELKSVRPSLGDRSGVGIGTGIIASPVCEAPMSCMMSSAMVSNLAGAAAGAVAGASTSCSTHEQLDVSWL